MARKKPTIQGIADLEQANAALAEIAAIQRELGLIEAEMNEIIDKAKAEAEAAKAPHAARLKELEAGLAAYALYNKGTLFATKKSVETAHGVLGFRQSTSIVAVKGLKLADVLAKVQELGLTEAVRVKTELDREAMRGWPDSRLTAVGAQRKVEDAFYYEVKSEELAA